MKNTQSHFLVVAIFSLLSVGQMACSSGNVNVTGAGGSNAAPTATGAPARTITDPAKAGGAGSNKVFYERVLVQDGRIEFVVALSYLLERSQSTSGFGVPLRVPQAFASVPIFSSGSDQVTYLRSTGIGADALVSTQLASGKLQTLFPFPKRVASFALHSTTGELAWAGMDGALSVVNLGDANAVAQAIKLDGNRARNVAWSAKGSRLLMQTSTDAWVFAKNGDTWQSEEVLKGVSAAAFGTDEDRLAIVGHDDHALRIVRLGGTAPAEESRNVLDSSEIYDFSWNAQQGFTYWTRLANGAQEIRTLSATAGSPAEKTVARLSVPAWTQGGVICPAWSKDGATLYFGDYIDNAYVVERLGLAEDASGGRPAIFAQAPADDEGFVCPKSE